MRSVTWAISLVLTASSAYAQRAREPEAPPLPTLPPSLMPQPGGLTADRVAERALRSSAQLRAAHANTEAADSARTEAAMAMIPNIALSARYTRLSPIDQPTIGSPNPTPLLLGAPTAAGLRVPCVGANGTVSQGTFDVVSGRSICGPTDLGAIQSPPAALRFPVILDSFALRGSITVPITDIPFRLARVYEAAGLQHQARRFDEEAARSQVATEARVAWYAWLRALGSAAVAEQGAESARHHRDDLLRFVEAGTVARVELMRVEAQVAETERLVIAAREGAALGEMRLRQVMHMAPTERIVIGEPLETPPAPTGALQDLLNRAWHDRPELASLERQIRALDANLSATRAGYYPSLAGVFNVDIANPNQRFIPQSPTFNTTWDATLQLSWSPTAVAQTSATVNRIVAQREAVRAQLVALREGLELEVRNAWMSVQNGQASIAAAQRQVAAAEESYRVRRERFLAGSSVSSDLTDAELDLLRARLGLVNASIDFREGIARLRRAVGTREATQ
jgi:outer membrane protein TolC